mmetsp:Transcript_7742/g.27580  ORF Transcript_7742/g.27580 Transcript_7742/m.27580 type:complete len:361 (+) Transcript_7742:1235-2317(+)
MRHWRLPRCDTRVSRRCHGVASPPWLHRSKNGTSRRARPQAKLREWTAAMAQAKRRSSSTHLPRIERRSCDVAKRRWYSWICSMHGAYSTCFMSEGTNEDAGSSSSKCDGRESTYAACRDAPSKDASCANMSAKRAKRGSCSPSARVHGSFVADGGGRSTKQARSGTDATHSPCETGEEKRRPRPRAPTNASKRDVCPPTDSTHVRSVEHVDVDEAQVRRKCAIATTTHRKCGSWFDEESFPRPEAPVHPTKRIVVRQDRGRNTNKDQGMTDSGRSFPLRGHRTSFLSIRTSQHHSLCTLGKTKGGETLPCRTRLRSHAHQHHDLGSWTQTFLKQRCQLGISVWYVALLALQSSDHIAEC